MCTQLLKFLAAYVIYSELLERPRLLSVYDNGCEATERGSFGDVEVCLRGGNDVTPPRQSRLMKMSAADARDAIEKWWAQ